MKPVTKYFVRTLLFNLLALGLLLLPVIGGSDNILMALWVFSAGQLIQLTVGLIMITNPKTNEIGKGMLLCVGVIFLIGLSVCTAMLSRFSAPAPH